MLEFLFNFLLGYAPSLSVVIFSVIILIVINIFYKVLVNQDNAKQIKQRTKDINKEMKDAQKAGEKEKQKKLMSDLLTENNKMMKMTIKPMIISLIIVVILLPSLAMFYGDKKIDANQNNVTLDGSNYQLEKTSNNVSVGNVTCSLPCKTPIGRYTYKITPEGNGIKIALIVATLPVSLPFLGDTFGWLGWYIICSIPLVIIIKKSMKIYM